VHHHHRNLPALPRSVRLRCATPPPPGRCATTRAERQARERTPRIRETGTFPLASRDVVLSSGNAISVTSDSFVNIGHAAAVGHVTYLLSTCCAVPIHSYLPFFTLAVALLLIALTQCPLCPAYLPCSLLAATVLASGAGWPRAPLLSCCSTNLLEEHGVRVSSLPFFSAARVGGGARSLRQAALFAPPSCLLEELAVGFVVYVASVCPTCFRCLIRMLQEFRADVAKVDLDFSGC
jgi:hypothetical protein